MKEEELLRKAEEMLLQFAETDDLTAKRKYFAWAQMYIDIARKRNPYLDLSNINNMSNQYGVTVT